MITEDEYEDGFSLADAGLSALMELSLYCRTKHVRRVAVLGTPSLLETAKLLMALRRTEFSACCHF